MNWITCIYRQLFYCKRRLCPHVKRIVPIIPANKLPWFWIGTTIYNNTVTVTEVVNTHIRYGIPITPELLSEITHINNKDAIWKYVDSKTLEEKEFPPEGIVIEDDSSY
jgi:hypothetical protein